MTSVVVKQGSAGRSRCPVNVVDPRMRRTCTDRIGKSTESVRCGIQGISVVFAAPPCAIFAG